MANIGRPPAETLRGARLFKAKYLLPDERETERFKELWKSVVEDFAPDHFRESDRPILSSYIRNVILLELAMADMEDRPFTVGKAVNPHLTAIKTITTMVGNLATKLRLTPSSRMQFSQSKQKSQFHEREKQGGSALPPSRSGLRLA